MKRSPADRLLDLLFPPKCCFCRALLPEGETGICSRCREVLPRLRGAEEERTGEFFRICLSPLAYEGAVRESIHRYKFRGMRGYSKGYAALMARLLEERGEGAWEVVTWVPVSRKRRRKRGYDQAALLAREVAAALGCQAVPTLEKVGDNPPQSGLKGEEVRRANVLGMYRCTAPQLVSQRRLLLVDDVITTGATLSECARVLRTAGCREVVCLTLASAGGKSGKGGKNF